ncbi:hypothetical protein, unlikely [Trypanosoma brucei gambiense DAL972]|uniref:Uncharacterized protein n=1 Tax=Trypanosoma brucei gambiense (strain MHOM/CI/86/DAL972) TaxID=679716 RepID=D0A0H0_TRYB9|nr:hypothetical protein, unlikely [Trypanosoma brucei gambiense DAL972]CBH16728.1 hypothetical protein, unlikely [Trypanosoma brucei gambiense DAL972]|eukprot:XP_011778992.1 hypothetical protein, unlikely [Trypanosoma brucei gambiense DAL972]
MKFLGFFCFYVFMCVCMWEMFIFQIIPFCFFFLLVVVFSSTRSSSSPPPQVVPFPFLFFSFALSLDFSWCSVHVPGEISTLSLNHLFLPFLSYAAAPFSFLLFFVFPF